MKFALGTVQFGLQYGVSNSNGRVTIEEADAIIQRAQLFGMDTLDTAIAYGDSENVLGQIGVGDWKVITKLPALPDVCDDITQWVYDQIQQSITRLRVPKLHGVMLHRPDQLLGSMGPRLFEALQNIKTQGMTQKIGISIYSAAELLPLLKNFNFDIVQAPLNLMDRVFEESGWAKRLHGEGIEVHTRSSFLQGLLLMDATQRPAKFDRWADYWRVWDDWLNTEGITPIQGCLRYVANLEDIDRVVVGVDTAAQLIQLIAAANGELSSLPKFNSLQDARLINPATWGQL